MGGYTTGGQRTATSRQFDNSRTLSRLRKHFRDSTALSNRALFWGASLVGAALLSAVPAVGNPTGGTVVGGSATIIGDGTASVTVNQATDRAIIEWTAFDIGATETTDFNQPSANAIALNRVTGGGLASQLLGTLTADGNVWIVNPNGVFFGANAEINVSGLLATTADILNDDFLGIGGDDPDTFAFDIPGTAGATVINAAGQSGTSTNPDAKITIADTGLGLLVAPGVENRGIIVATLGKVVLGGTETFTLDLTGDNLTLFQVTGAGITGATSELIANGGNISADGGLVLMTANAAADIVGDAINMTGLIRADTVSTAGGTIILSGGSNGSVATTGSLLARGADVGESGGSIMISGTAADIGTGAIVDASGTVAGGQIDLDVTTATLDADVNVAGGTEGTVSGTASTVHVASDNASIQDAIDIAGVGAVLNIGAGTYTEDLTIRTAGLDLAGDDKTTTTIKGVATNPQSSFPLATPNIDIQANGVEIHDFTIASPDAGPDEYSSGIVLSGANINIHDNDFTISQAADADGTIDANGNTSVAIQSWSGAVLAGANVDGLTISNNTFSGTPFEGYYGIYINPQDAAPTDRVTIAGNEFSGTIWRGISTERSQTDITGNTITTDTIAGGFGGNSGVMVTNFAGDAVDDVQISGNTIRGNSAITDAGFADGLRLGFPTLAVPLTNLQVANNTFTKNNAHVALYSDIRVDATTNEFDGVAAGNTLTDDEGFALEDTIDHGLDDPADGFDGFVITRASDVYVTQDSGSVQRGVDRAADGANDTVNVEGGTYAEAVTVDRRLDLDLSDTVIVNSLTADAQIGLRGNLTSDGGNLTFNQFLRLAGNTSLDTDVAGGTKAAGDVFINLGVGGVSELRVDATADGSAASGNVTLTEAGGDTAPLLALTVLGDTLALDGDVFVDGGGVVDLTGLSNIELATNVTIDTDTKDEGTTAAGNILFGTAAVDGDGFGPRSLTLDATAKNDDGSANTAGAISLGEVGQATRLASLEATGASIALNGAIATDGGLVALTATDSGLVVGQHIESGGGEIALTGDGVAFGSATVDADGGTVTVDGGDNQISTASGTLVLTTGRAEFIADAMDIDGGSQIGGDGAGALASTVVLRPSSAGTTIGVASDAFGDLQLDTAELSAVHATHVRIGSPGGADAPGENAAGRIQVGDAVTPTQPAWTPDATFAPGTLTLASGAGITQERAVDLSASGGGLLLRAGDNVVLGDTGNDLGEIAARLTAGRSLTVANADLLTVGELEDDIGTVTGITATGGVTLRTNSLAVDQQIVATGNAAAIETLAGTNRAIDLGSADDTIAALALSDQELDRIGASVVRIGTSDSGDITVSESITPAGTSTLSLATGGSVTQQPGDTISVANLVVNAGNTLALTRANDVDVLAARSGSALSFTDADGFTVGSADGLNGVISGSSLLLTANAGNVAVADTSEPLDLNSEFFMQVLLLGAGSEFSVAGDAAVQSNQSSVLVRADDIELDGTVTAAPGGFGGAIFQTATADRPTFVGGGGSPGDDTDLDLDAGEIGRTSAAYIWIGQAYSDASGIVQAGDMTVGALAPEEIRDFTYLILESGNDITLTDTIDGSVDNFWLLADRFGSNVGGQSFRVGGDITVLQDVGVNERPGFVWMNAENVDIRQHFVANQILVDVEGSFTNVDLLPFDPDRFEGLDVNRLSISRASTITAFGAIRQINTKAAALDLSNFDINIRDEFGDIPDPVTAARDNDYRFNTCIIGTLDCVDLPLLLPVGALDLSLDEQRLLRDAIGRSEEEFEDLLSNSGNEELW